MTPPCTTDFDDWLVAHFARIGSFTMLIVLVGIGETTIGLLRSSYLHVVGDETRWPEMVALFAGAGADWDGAAFFPADPDGLVPDRLARQRLASLVRHLESDRSIISHGAFFDTRGLRLKLEEVPRL